MRQHIALILILLGAAVILGLALFKFFSGPGFSIPRSVSGSVQQYGQDAREYNQAVEQEPSQQQADYTATPGRSDRARIMMPEVVQRIEEHVSVLRSETLAESIAALDDVLLYRWPGPSPDLVPILPSPPLQDTRHEKKEIEEVLSNRRVLKVLSELRGVPTTDANQLLRIALDGAIDQYQELWDQDYQMLLDHLEQRRKDGGEFLSFARGVGNAENIELPGARAEVLALCFVAGELNASDLNGDLLEVAKLAASQRDAAYALAREEPMAGSMWSLAMYSVYCRPLLATALARTALQPEAILSRHGKQSYKLTHYDAAITPFDQPVYYGLPPDFSNGSMEVTFIVGIDDQEFDEIVAALSD